MKNKDYIYMLYTIIAFLASIIVYGAAKIWNLGFGLRYISSTAMMVSGILLLVGLWDVIKKKYFNKQKNNQTNSQDKPNQDDEFENIIEYKICEVDKTFYDEDEWWKEFAPIIAEIVQDQIDKVYKNKTINNSYTDEVLKNIIDDSFKNVSYYPKGLKEKTKEYFFKLRDKKFETGSLHKDEVSTLIKSVFENWSELSETTPQKQDDNEIKELMLDGLKGIDYKMRPQLEHDFTEMFNQPFNQVISKEKFRINNTNCNLYSFSPNYILNCKLGGFLCMIEIVSTPKRYFACELSYGTSFELCEWVFDGKKNICHLTYGEIINSPTDLINFRQKLKAKLKSILTENHS